MSIQSDAVRSKVTPVGASKCEVCGSMRADCLQWKTGLFFYTTICDSCLAHMIRRCDPAKSGDSE